MEKDLDLCRIWKDEKQTLGELSVDDVVVYSLERPDLNNDGIDGNEKQKSCIPDGRYPITYIKNHKKFGNCFLVHNVPGRSGIMMHSGTHYKHTLGCILPALDQKDITGDGILDNTSSKAALKKLFNVKGITHINVWTRP